MAAINELFTLEYGHSLELNRLEQVEGPESVNFVSRTARNNGVSARIALIPSKAPAAAGTITVALNGQGGAGVAFLQPFPYYSGFHVMILTPKVPMTEQEKLWWVMCITANRFRFGFGRQANRTLKDLELPDPSAVPAWVGVADTDVVKGLTNPQIASPTPTLDTTTWRAFRYDEVFEIKKGYYNKKPPLDPTGAGVPFIGATENRNGITAAIAMDDLSQYSRDGRIVSDEPISRKIFPGGCVTVSNNGSVGEAFYQAVPFTCTHDVNPLYLKDKKTPLTPELGLFLAALIRGEKYRWGFGRKWRPIRMPDSIIKLPVNPKGKPDWAYMENYIRTLPYSSQLTA